MDSRETRSGIRPLLAPIHSDHDADLAGGLLYRSTGANCKLRPFGRVADGHGLGLDLELEISMMSLVAQRADIGHQSGEGSLDRLAGGVAGKGFSPVERENKAALVQDGNAVCRREGQSDAGVGQNPGKENSQIGFHGQRNVWPFEINTLASGKFLRVAIGRNPRDGAVASSVRSD